jgi:WD40 repeat protein
MQIAEPNLPPGFTLRHTLRGHDGEIRRIAWAPNGKYIASPSSDAIRVWDTESGEEVWALIGHKGVILSVAWSPDSTVLASGGQDNTLRLWNVKNGTLTKTIEDEQGWINTLGWSPDGKTIAAGVEDGIVRLWESSTGKRLAALSGHKGNINGIAWSSTGERLASASGDSTVRIWNARNGEVLHVLRGHGDWAFSVAWSPDETFLASGALDASIRIWDPTRGILLAILEGHSAKISSVSFSSGGHVLASKAADSTVRIWSCDTWKQMAILPEASSGNRAPSLAFHPRAPALATLGERDKVIRIWDLKFDLLFAKKVRTIRYTTAKIVLVGDSGVGKTGLGWRLAHGAFKEHPSTHGMQFWLLESLYATRDDATECEAVLWDLAGQPDYRLIHSLFLEDAELALVLFDPTDRHDPLGGVEFWLEVLSHRRGRPCRTILCGARTDRGDTTLASEEIEALCRDRGITGGYVATSAKEGYGLDKLVESIREQIVWNDIATTTTTPTFKRIKDYVLSLKQGAARDGLLLSPSELRDRLQALDQRSGFSDAEMMTAVEHLAKHGYVRTLRTASGEQSILLAPEVLNNLAASFVLEARRNPKGLGALDEGRLLRGEYVFPEVGKLPEHDQKTLLDAATVLFVENNVCFRESHGQTTLLIFPELINRKKPPGEMQMCDDVTYTVRGSVGNLYAALVVLLGYTSVFTRTDQWQNQAQYELGGGEICGFKLAAERQGELQFVLFYGLQVARSTRMLFQGLFERFLESREVTVTRYPPLECSNCHYRQERAEVIRRTLEKRSFLFCSNCGERMVLLKADEEVVLSAQERTKLDRERATANQRTKFESALRQLDAFVRKEAITAPSCFVSYAWGNREHEGWVEKELAPDMQKAGVNVILDRWASSAIGSNIARFISLIDESARILVVGTPLYLKKYENKVSTTGSVVAAEVDLINKRLLGTEEEKKTVLPLLLEGDERRSFPPLMQLRVYADFRLPGHYFANAFDLILSVYGIRFNDQAVADLRTVLRPDAGST